MNADLATILFTNLIKNSIIHNKPGGFVKVFITRNAVVFENSAMNGALDGETIFARFHSGQPSASSTGLGLAIAKAIATLYDFDLVYEFNQVHRIILKF